MKNIANFLIISALSVNPLFAQELIDKGYRLPFDSVTKNFSLMKLSLEAPVLVKHIIQSNPRIDKFEAELIAHNILKAAKCFHIDPWVLTGLVKKESSFQKDAVSPTGASGLTQFTGLGFKEVNDQLGFRGKSGASDNAIQYYTARIENCFDPNWINIWDKVAVSEDHPDFYNLLKEEVKTDIPTSLAYGAILLKTYVSYIDSKSVLLDTPLSLSETYFQALQIYNGEEGDRKVRYAKAIFNNLQKLYPKEVNFPFLIETPPTPPVQPLE